MAQWNHRQKYNIQKEVAEKKSKFKFSKLARRQALISAFSVAAVFVVILGSTYAIFSSVNKSKDYNTLNVGTLEIAYDDTSTGLGNIINLNGAYPISDTEGLKLAPYSFKITNNGTLDTTYKISIVDDMNMISADGCSSNLLSKANIKVSIDGGTPVLLSATGTDYVVKTASLPAKASQRHTVRLWLDENSGNEVLGKHYHGKIVISSENTKDSFAPGDMVTFGGKTWNVLHDDQDSVTLILHGDAGVAEFHSTYTGTWSDSTLRASLNNESTGFLSEIPSTDRAKILTQTVEGVAGKVRLITKQEINTLYGVECTYNNCFYGPPAPTSENLQAKLPWLFDNVSSSGLDFWGQTWVSGSSPLYISPTYICQSCPNATGHYPVKPVIAVNKSDLVGYSSYEVGDAVTLLDNSTWHVIKKSNKKEAYVTLLKDSILDYDGNGTIDSSDYIKFDTAAGPTLSGEYSYSTTRSTSIGYYIQNTYLPSLRTSLSSKTGSNTNYIQARLLKLDEALQFPNTFNNAMPAYIISSDAYPWLRGDPVKPFWLMDLKNELDGYYFTAGGGTGLENGVIYSSQTYMTYGIRPVVTLSKANIK